MNKKLTFARKNAICTLLILVTTFTLISSLATIPVYPSTEIDFDPSSLTYDIGTNATIGTLFNVTAKVEDVTDLAVFQVCLLFNDTFINVTRWYEPTWDPEYVFNGKTTLPVPFPPDYTYESIGPGNASATVGASLFPAPPMQPSFTGSGILCIIEFNITALPSEGETYNSTLAIDKIFPYDTYLLDSPGDEIPGVTKENGYIEIIPEFNPFLILPVFIVITLIAIAFAKNAARKSKSYRVRVNS